jgi:hypothetical protein
VTLPGARDGISELNGFPPGRCQCSGCREWPRFRPTDAKRTATSVAAYRSARAASCLQFVGALHEHVREPPSLPSLNSALLMQSLVTTTSDQPEPEHLDHRRRVSFSRERWPGFHTRHFLDLCHRFTRFHDRHRTGDDSARRRNAALVATQLGGRNVTTLLLRRRVLRAAFRNCRVDCVWTEPQPSPHSSTFTIASVQDLLSRTRCGCTKSTASCDHAPYPCHFGHLSLSTIPGGTRT